MKDRPAFITGSHAYGHPHEKSDVDLVVLMEADTADTLSALADSDDGYDDVSCSLRFGKLNLLCFWDEHAYDAWLKVNKELVEEASGGEAPTRDQAVQRFKAALRGC